MFFSSEFNGIKTYRSWLPAKERIPYANKDVRHTIILMNLGHIGDFFISLSAIRLARRLFSNYRLILIVSSWNRRFAEQLGEIDEVLTFDYFKQSIQKDRTQMHQISFDLFENLSPSVAFINLRPLGDTNDILKYVKANYIISYGSGIISKNIFYLNGQKLSIKVPKLQRFLGKIGLGKFVEKKKKKLSKFLLHSSVQSEFAVQYAHSLINSTSNATNSYINSSANVDERGYILISPFTNSTLRDWPLSNFFSLVEKLLSNYNFEIRLVYRYDGLNDIQKKQIDIYREKFIDREGLAFKHDLDAEKFLEEIRAASLVISNNSSAGHISSSMNIPTVGIFTASHLPEAWGFRGQNVSILTSAVSCYGCGLDFEEENCPNNIVCKKNLTPQIVYQEVKYVIENLKLT